MIENNKIEQMATVISNFCDKHQYDLTEQEIDDIALDMADKGYGNVSEYKAEREMLGSQIKVLKQRFNDKYIEVDNLNRDYRNAFERLKSQQQEIERLKTENCELTKKLEARLTCDFVKTAQKQAQIEVLNRLKSLSIYDDNYLDGYVFIDDIEKLLEELKK